MIGKLVSTSIDLATLPARLTIKGSLKALEASNLMPGGLEQFREDMQQLLVEMDADFDRNVDDMTEREREAAAIQEIGRAEHHIIGALVSMVRLVRLATAEDSRVIEHETISDRIEP